MSLPPTHPDWVPDGHVLCIGCRRVLSLRASDGTLNDPPPVVDGLCGFCIRDMRREAEAARPRAVQASLSWETLLAERDRLREALERISAACPGPGWYGDVAREALRNDT